MRITRIYLAGFKSFAQPTEITFPHDPVAIVGPNGCGKSNVIDALRWVMGESSARFLRGQQAEDVIFAGSKERAAAEQAVVELTLDNHQQRITGPFAAYRQLTIRRRLSRDGPSRYEINNTRVRKRDVVDLFLGTGVGARSYSVIEQGQVNRIVDASPEHLRGYLEEAAGISVYRERRRETNNRIAHTRENLARLQDIRHELEQQRENLAQQARQAERYRELAASLRHDNLLLAEIAVAENKQARARLEQQQADCEQQLARVLADHQQIKTLEAQLQAQHQRLRAQWQWYADEFEQQTQLCQKITEEKAQLATRRAEIKTSLTHDQQTWQQHCDEQQSISAQIQRLQARQPALSQALNRSETALKEQQNLIQQCQQKLQQAREQHLKATSAQIQPQREKAACQAELDNLKRTYQRLEQNPLRRELDALSQRLEKLTKQEQTEQQQSQQSAERLEQLAAAHQKLQKTLNEQRAKTADAKGHFEAQQRHHQALVTEQRALAKLHRQPKESPSAYPRLQDYLIEHRNVPSWIAHALDQAIHARVLSHDEFLQLQPQTLSAKPGYFVRLDHPDELEARVAEWGALFSEDLSSALAQRDALKDGQRWVTPDGWQVSRNWVGRADSDRNAEQLAQRQRLRALEKQIEQALEQRNLAQAEYQRQHQAEQQQQQECDRLAQQQRQAQEAHRQSEHQLDKIQHSKAALLEQQQALQVRLDDEQQQRRQVQTQISAAETRLQVLQQQIEQTENHLVETQTAQQQCQQALDQAEEKADTLRKQRAQARRDVEEQQRQKRALQERYQRLEVQADQAQRRLTENRKMLAELDAEQDALQARLAEQQRKTAALKAQREEKAEQLKILEQQRAQLSDKRITVEQSLEQARAEHNRLALKAERLQTQGEHHQQACAQARERAADDPISSQDLGQQIEQLLAHPEQQQALKTRQRQTRQAIDQLGGVNLNAIADHQAIVARIDDLNAQLDDLHTALAQLNDAIATMDEQTRSRFQQTFDAVNHRLGQRFAQLFGGGEAHLALDGDDMLNAGVLLMARPPGKKVAHLSLLSGGERALTAVALIFALFELNPAPFCVLDEIDAPLDEANVERFCAMVASMSEQVQFMYITHNKTTMAHAAALIGVTMQEPGVSRIVSVDMQQALNYVES
ncbi:MAG TPA: hypothetical protein ENM98_00220 [Halothiobacillaceae bacterium]|nr:hypothetical protein [Halothiobacillaceae bacterium]